MRTGPCWHRCSKSSLNGSRDWWWSAMGGAPALSLVRIVRQPWGSTEAQEVHALFDAIVASVVRVADGTFFGY